MISDGVLLIDKGFGLTSSEAVQTVKRLTDSRKTGHTGTLDPCATGLLIMTLGRATKISTYLDTGRKRYLAKIRLGESRETYDRFGKLFDRQNVSIEFEEIEHILNDFEGDFEQIIPRYSAAHVEGKRMYKMARRGEETPIKKKIVKIYEINILEYDPPFLELDIACESGTYIRSIAHQLGQSLGCGAHIYTLVRTEAGRFKLDRAVTLVQLEAAIKMELFDDYFIPIDNALAMPSIVIGRPKSEGVKQGREIFESDAAPGEMRFSKGDRITVKSDLGRLLAIGKALISSDELAKGSCEKTKVFEYKRVI
ncbi:MAG: tRNA pseudouridine(55) synthase TruB [candidate division Zixibacteria bacterium]|nr:tRNA pseudouridine(55) synthase TruB [candidate division Zixibacteria bacterium]